MAADYTCLCGGWFGNIAVHVRVRFHAAAQHGTRQRDPALQMRL